MNRPVIGLNMDFMETGAGKPSMVCRAAYADAIIEAGGIPYLVPCAADGDLLDFHIDRVNAFILVGGKDYNPKHFGEPLHEKTELIHERREAVDLLLADKVLETGMPVLGICAGIQLISIVRAGSIVQHLATAEYHVDGRHHTIRITGGTIVKELFGDDRITVNSYHHQGVRADDPGAGMVVSAVGSDGVVEAIESTGHRFLLGLQWHPELMEDPEHRLKIFGALISAAAK